MWVAAGSWQAGPPMRRRYAPWLSMPVPKQSRHVTPSPWSSLTRPVPPQVQQGRCEITGFTSLRVEVFSLRPFPVWRGSG